MAFDLSAFRVQPRPEEKVGIGSSMVDPHGGINPQPGMGMGMIPPKPGGFLGPMVGAPTPMPTPQMPMSQPGGAMKAPMGAEVGAIGATPPAINRPTTRPNSFRSARRGRLGMF